MRRWHHGYGPGLRLGTYGSPWLPRVYRLPFDQALTHWHCLGLSGGGKSHFLAALYIGFLDAGFSATLIDPHGDLARLVLHHLIARGTYRDDAAYERILYFDLPRAERCDRYLPWNLLRQQAPAHIIAENFTEAMHRAFPDLSERAPIFDTLMPDIVMLLLANDLPLTATYRTLMDRPFRDALLAQSSDEDLLRFFRRVYDQLRPSEQSQYAGVVLRRARQLTRLPLFRHCFSHPENRLDFQRILANGQSVILNLGLPVESAKGLLGCLATISLQQAVLARAGEDEEERTTKPHILLIDEFSSFAPQSAKALATMLSQCRKFGLFIVMAHQNWDQADERLKAAMQNVGVEVVFSLGRDDAEHSAPIIGRVKPDVVKHAVSDPTALERTHPVYAPMGEQWEAWVQTLRDLPRGEAFVKPLRGPATRIRTTYMGRPQLDRQVVAAIHEQYLSRYFAAPAAEPVWEPQGIPPVVGEVPLDD